jgi:hypothetical protein
MSWGFYEIVVRATGHKMNLMPRLFSTTIVAMVVATIVFATSLPTLAGVAIAQQATATPASGAGSPRVGDEVTYINESGGTVAILKVTQMVQPWDEYGDYYTPDPGTEYIAFVIEFTHLGSRGDLVVRADDFRLQDGDGFLISRSWTDGIDSAVVKPSEDPVAIPPGQTGEIVVVFPVLIGIGLNQLLWQPDYDRLITVTDLRD